VKQQNNNPLYRPSLRHAHSRSVPTRLTIPAGDIAAALRRLAAGIAARHGNTTNLVFLGIARGGVACCERLASAVGEQLRRNLPCGVLNVSFHRDDVGRNPIPDLSTATSIPQDLEGAVVVLVDDVVFTGRTVRAALEELFSHGRPARVELAVLVDRGNRCLPIAPDYAGFVEKTAPDERVTVRLDPADPARDVIEIKGPAA
jgi:pyrimidine operon attenuation protein / uracil phosphoribosyltransferase